MRPELRRFYEDMVERLSDSILEDIDRQILGDIYDRAEFKELHPKSQDCSLEEEFFERTSECQ